MSFFEYFLILSDFVNSVEFSIANFYLKKVRDNKNVFSGLSLKYKKGIRNSLDN